MNKFSGPHDPDYRAVSGKIAMILSEIRTKSVLTNADIYIRKTHYSKEKLEIVRISGETLVMDQCYINLALVEHVDDGLNRSRDRDMASQSSAFTLTARLNVQMPDKQSLIELP